METYPCASAPLSDYIAEPWECNTQCCLETNQHYNLSYPFATCTEYQYLHCGIKKNGMQTYYANVLKEENTALGFATFKNGDGIQQLLARMPDDQAVREWELYALEDMRWNGNHQSHMIYWSQYII
jgi:hypothetical protein